MLKILTNHKQRMKGPMAVQNKSQKLKVEESADPNYEHFLKNRKV